MGNLKEIRIRIASVESTQKITSAMKLVSAAKLRRAQTAIVSLRPYTQKLNEILQNLAATVETDSDMPLFAVRRPRNVIIVVITSNRGLCGSFNSNIIKEVNRTVHEQYAEQADAGLVKLICIGKKANEYLSKSYEVLQFHESLLDKPEFGIIADMAQFLMDEFTAKRVDRVEIIYNRFVNPATQHLERESFLPIEPLTMQNSNKQLNSDYIFEPDKAQLMETLLPKILKTKLYKTLIDSIASEHGARMTSMAKATDNATEIIKDLKLKYNNARQSSITNELIEIVSGAEALNN
ncbi:MAG: ATP synthase F1 subunit gamma [Bacteroidales bacterium]|jgi:F-type H+-transporting ATPase subunit gamma|nr:ATP synthase F1 subunit gamma [Bacteroidales bacterium]